MNQDFTVMQRLGIFVFVFLCGIPALEVNGFGFGMNLTLTTALLVASAGGIIGGAMICSRPVMAGIIGGLIAGPVGLLAVYFYTQHRESVWDMELVIVQGIACLPGVGVGWLLKKMLDDSDASGSQDLDFS